MIRILRILAPNPGPFTLEGTNTWVVGENPSVVIDPGPNDASHILSVLDAAEPISAILLTHKHPDHAPGAGRLSAASRAPVHAFRPEDVERPLRNGEVIAAGRASLRVIHTPGHTRDHVCFLLEPERLLFTGDAVLGRGTSVVDPPDGDMALYVRSLHAMLDLNARSLHPGHGPVIWGARTKLEEYVVHREQRERQVLEALEGGLSTPGEIVPGIYGREVPESMYAVAARSVLAHLLKLEREGRVRRTGKQERFTLVERKPCARCGRPAVAGSKYCGRCAVAVLQEGPAHGRERGDDEAP